MKNFKGYIYVITNKINRKRYVGQTRRTINARWKEHIRNSKNNVSNQYICAAIDKYGKDNFDIKEICNIECSAKEELVDKLNELEIFYISQYNTLKPSGYNIATGGDMCPNTFKEKRVEQYDRYFNKLCTYESISDASRITGIYQSDISKCCLKINKSAKGFFWCFEGEIIDKTLKLKNRHVYQYTLDGNFVEEYSSIIEASIKNNIDSANIHSCCKKKAKSAGGFVWTYNKETYIEYRVDSNRKVIQYNLENNVVSKYKSIKEASNKTNIRYNGIYNCCRGSSKTAGGYIWKYDIA